MTNAPISDWRLKLKRAQEHFNALGKSIEGFVNSDAYGFEVTEPERGSEQDTWVGQLLLRISKQPPIDDWALIIGDLVHNTRSALDIMAFQGGANSFPICVDPADFKDRGRKAISGLSDKRRALVEREQPCERWKNDPPSDPLAILADLDNAGKHRIIPTTVSWFGTESLGLEQTDLAHMRVLLTGMHPPEDRAPLATIVYRVVGPNPKMEVEPSKAAKIFFGEGSDRAVEKPVYETLVAIGARVATLVSDFEQET